MNGIPNVPITTLAGVASLTDLLPELPLPTPLPSTVTNKSLLFHPRLAEESKRALKLRDDPLVAQLSKALAQTSTEHIELKDPLASDVIEGDVSELLGAILQCKPDVFRSKKSVDGVDSTPVPTASPAAGVSPRQMVPPAYPPPQSTQQSPYQTQFSPYPTPKTPSTPNSPGRAPAGPTPSPKYNQHGSPFQQQFSQFTQMTGAGAMAAGVSPNAQPVNGNLAASSSNSSPASQKSGNMSPPRQKAPPHVKAATPVSSSAPQKATTTTTPPAPTTNSSRHPDVNAIPSQLTPPADVKPDSATSNKPPSETRASTRAVNNSHNGHDTVKARIREPVVLLEPLNMEFKWKTCRPPTKAISAMQSRLAPKPEPPAPKAPSLTEKIKSSTPQIRLLRIEECFDELKVKKRTGRGGGGDATEVSLKLNKQRLNDLQHSYNAIDKDGRKRRRSESSYGDDPPSPVSYAQRIGEYSLSLSERVKRRRRETQKEEDDEDDHDHFAIQRSTIPVQVPKEKTEKKRRKERANRGLDMHLTMEERTGSGSFRRFQGQLDQLFEVIEDGDVQAAVHVEGDSHHHKHKSKSKRPNAVTGEDEDMDVPAELLVARTTMAELANEAAKLKSIGVLNLVTTDKLVRLQNVLLWNIRDACKILPNMSQLDESDDDDDEVRSWREMAAERVIRSTEAALLALYIMTSDNMPKQVYNEDVIEKACHLAKFQLINSIYPEYDPVYRISTHKKDAYTSSKQKRARAGAVKHKSVILLYNKLTELVSLLSELVQVQELTDTVILLISSLGVAPFFVENVSELQLSAIRLVTTIFSKYEKHRALIMEDIFASLARLPSTKRNLRSYRLSSEESIQMVTALVLQLIQSVVKLPSLDDDDNPDEQDTRKKKDVNLRDEKITRQHLAENEVAIVTSYETSLRAAHNFLSVYLKKCTIKGEEDYRALFENFIQDLLTTVNKPEWPAAEMLLSLLGRLLVQHFSNKSVDMSVRVASLDYLGIVAARLRKDALSSHMNQEVIDEILKEVKTDDLDSSIVGKTQKKNPHMDDADPTQLLQKALIDYFTANARTDPVYHFARQFYISQWYRDSNAEATRAVQSSKKLNSKHTPVKKSDSDQSGSDSDEETTPEQDEVAKSRQVLQRAEKRKLFLISQLQILSSRLSKDITTTLDYENACLCVRYLAANRPFSHSFDIYLTQILKVLCETSVAVRTKAMKCLTAVVEVDPAILARDDMQRGVHGRFMDQSTSVREAAVELVGKFILVRPELTATYYQMLSDRILDTGISVRKRVIKIFRDICLEQPEFDKIPEMCVRMIRRVNDEEGIKKLVTEVFQTMWFTPVRQKENPQALLRKVLNIADVVSASRDSGWEWLEQLLEGLLRKEEELHHKPVETSCRQIVNCLVENVLKLEEKSADTQRSSSIRLVSCLSTLYLFSKVKPNLMTDHAMTLQPYLEIKCNTPNDQMVIYNIARILELTVPLLEHPAQSFLTQLEEDMMKLILQQGMTVLQSCVSCLGAIINQVSHNYQLVKDCFRKFYSILTRLVSEHTKDPNSAMLAQNKPTLLRSLFTIGLLCCHFDFDGKDMSTEQSGSAAKIRDRVFDVLMYFTTHEEEVVEMKSLTGLGFMCQTHYDYMLGSRLKEYYIHVLTWHQSVRLKCQVLKNLHNYLIEEEVKMIKADHEWRKTAEKEDLKEMGDVQSGMASTVMQVYLKEVLESFFNATVQVRSTALAVICLVLKQGLVHPVQCVPYLIAMGTDSDLKNRTKADQQLQEIDKKYPGFIHMKALAGIKMSYRLQCVLQEASYNDSVSNANNEEEVLFPIVRGQRMDDQQNVQSVSSLNTFLYSLVRNSRQHRRALISSLLKLFDEDAKTSLAELLYLSDNLACFNYSSADEPLYVMHQIDIIVSVSGSNIIQSFRENFFPEKMNENGEIQAVDDEEEDNVDLLLPRVDPDRGDVLHELCKLSQGCILLLVVKHHLKDIYGLTDSKIHRYSPNDSSKLYDKQITRRGHTTMFDPKQTLEILRRDIPEEIDEQTKRLLAEEYLDFKYLMMSIDPADEDEEDGEKASGHGTPMGGRTPLGPGATDQNAESHGAPSEGTSDPGASSQVTVPPHVPPPIKVAKLAPPTYISKHSYLLEKKRSPAAKSRAPQQRHSQHNPPKSKVALVKKKKRRRIKRVSDSESAHDSEAGSDPDWR